MKSVKFNLVATLLSVLNSIAVLVIGWACHKGMDLSDESFYFMGYLYSKNPYLDPASFHIVFDRLFSYWDMTLIDVRLLRLLLTIIASFPLYFGIRRLIQLNSVKEKFILFNIILSGMMLSYAWAPLALSYNSMSCILIATISGFWILTFTSDKLYLKAVYAFLLGFLCILLFYVKITNVILFPILAFGTLYWINKGNNLGKLTTAYAIILIIVSFGIGIISSLALYSGGLTSISDTLEQYTRETFAMSDNKSHSPAHLKKRYFDNAEMVLTRLKYPLLLIIGLFTAIKLYLARSKKKNKSLVHKLFLVIGILIFIITVTQNKYWLGGAGFHYRVLIPYIFIGVLAFLDRLLENKRIDYVLVLSLLAIPLAGAIGTNNGLSAQVLFYGVFIFLLLHYLINSSGTLWYKNILLVGMVLLCSSQILTATIINPYRQSGLSNSIKALEGVKSLEGLKVDNGLYQLKDELAFLEKIEAEYVFAYSSHRGMALLIDKVPYTLDWFHETDPDKMCRAIDKSDIEQREIIFLIPEELPLENEAIDCLSNKGIHFREDFHQVKSIKFFDHRKKKELTLNIYLASK